MKFLNKSIWLSLTCLVLSACGGLGGSLSSATTTPSTNTKIVSDRLGGRPGQPFAQRLSQTSYPKSLIKDPEAMKRILGEDKDSNGIRDDVDVFITTLTTDPAKLKAFQQYARVSQKGFLVSTKAEARVNNDEAVRALKCIDKIEKESGAAHKEIYQNVLDVRKITQKILNTMERILRSDEVDVLSHGVTFYFDPAEDVSKACD
jgi:hypothetical protein